MLVERSKADEKWMWHHPWHHGVKEDGAGGSGGCGKKKVGGSGGCGKQK